LTDQPSQLPFSASIKGLKLNRGVKVHVQQAKCISPAWLDSGRACNAQPVQPDAHRDQFEASTSNDLLGTHVYIVWSFSHEPQNISDEFDLLMFLTNYRLVSHA
jgi:hypothetical protein